MSSTVEPGDRLEMTGRVRAALAGLMDIESYSWSERGILTLRGQLMGPARSLYRTIRSRLEQLGFTPFLRRRDERDELVALPGVAEHAPPRLITPLLLFLVTVLTTLLTGALNEQNVCVDSVPALLGLLGTILTSPAALASGVPFAATLMGILLTHEMGHYVVGRLRNAPVSLPYFIPLPPGIGLTGTMGAVIVQREPMQDRQTVLEVGIAGPLAGLVVAIPLLLYGLSISPVGGPPTPPPGCPPIYLQEGNSLLYAAAKLAVFGQFLPSNGQDVQLGAVAMGAWIGLLVTMINMMPIGQLDGGHVAYALLGDRSRYLAYAMIGLCLALGLLLPNNTIWLVWAVVAFLIGARHPPPLDDISRLGPRHAALAVFGLAVFVLLFMPTPLMEVIPPGYVPTALLP